MINTSHPILECYLSDSFHQGIEAYSSLETPTAEDLFWAGQCFFGLDRNVQALDCFYRAQSLGLEDGLVFAASVLRFSDSPTRAEQVLNETVRAQLSTFGQAAWQREYGLQLLAARQLRAATLELERAWQLAASDPLGRRLLPRYSQSLALALLELGRDASALQYLDAALNSATSNAGLLILRAAARAYTGDLLGAEADLKAFDQQVPLEQRARAGLVHGFLARSQGLLESAASTYLETASSAKHLGEWETEFYAELALSALLTEQGSLYVAQAHLARARGLLPRDHHSGPVFEALIAVRHAALLVRHGTPEAVQLLEEASQLFEAHDLERHAGLAALHLAEACFQSNQQAAGFQALAKAVNARQALGSRAYFALELRALPQVFEVVCATRQVGTEVLRADWLALEAQCPEEVQVLTLGTSEIRLKGRSIKLEGGTCKAVEFLAFLLEEGESPIEQIIAALFDEGTHATARNRIHKLRESIAQQIPGLTIPYCKVRNSYQLEPAGVRLRFDLRGVRQALQQGGLVGMQRALALYPGTFLPSSDLAWVEDKRFRLEFDLATVGLEALRDLFSLERFEECLRLAERLSDIASLNLEVQLMVLKATARVHGRLAARARFQRVDPLVQEDLRAMPEVQLELAGAEQDSLN